MIEKIKQTEIDERKVANLPTRPNNPRLYGGEVLSPEKLKARFDALALLAIDRLNSLIEIMNNGDITDEIPVLTIGEGDDAQILTISELAEKVVDGSLPDIMKVTGSKTLRQFINEAYSAVGNLIAGSAPGSLIQVQGGARSSSGKLDPQSIADGINAVLLGSNHHAYGVNGFSAGRQGKTYQNSSATFGGGCTAGCEEYQRQFESRISELMLEFPQEEGEDDEAYILRVYSKLTSDEKYLYYSFAFATGNGTKALKRNSSSFGGGSVADNENVMAQGLHTYGRGKDQHVEGRWNIIDYLSIFAHIIGNGTDEEHRSNAYTLDWEGNGWFAGEVRVGAEKEKLLTEKDLTSILAPALDSILEIQDKLIGGETV